MSQELISTWLELEPGQWPPNHYQLLGLHPGESDANLIEERVHQRLDMVRRYQMMYPDQATEAMNLLAQAFVCLTDPAAKKVYDFDLGLNGAAPPGVAPAAQGTTATQVESAEPTEPDEPVVVLFNPTGTEALPPPQRVPYSATEAPPPQHVTYSAAAAPAPPIRVPASGTEAPASPVEVPYSEALPPPPVAQVVNDPGSALAPAPEAIPVEPAPAAPPAPLTRRAARRALYRRIARARNLSDHWSQLGKYIASAKRRLTRPAEATDFLRQLGGIREHLSDLPPLLGQAGQVGYHIVTLAQLNSVPTFQTLALEQREVLSRDWHDGQKVLAEHRAALRAEVRALRRQSTLDRAGRAVVRFVKDHPGAALLAVALLSLVVVLFRTCVFDWLPR
jgi:hypothetical protein